MFPFRYLDRNEFNDFELIEGLKSEYFLEICKLYLKPFLSKDFCTKIFQYILAETSIGFYRDVTKRPRLSSNSANGHDFAACEDKWREKAPKIIEKCLKFLFESEDGEQRPLLNYVKCLEITDRDGIWTLSTNCVKIITANCLKLESLNISGRKMVPVDALVPFFENLKVSNLRRFRLAGITDDMPMWYLYQLRNET